MFRDPIGRDVPTIGDDQQSQQATQLRGQRHFATGLDHLDRPQDPYLHRCLRVHAIRLDEPGHRHVTVPRGNRDAAVTTTQHDHFTAHDRAGNHQ